MTESRLKSLGLFSDPILLLINIASASEMNMWKTKFADFHANFKRTSPAGVREVTTVEDAMEELTQWPLPFAVLVVGSGVFEEGKTDTCFRLHQTLASYLENSKGTVVICGNAAVYMEREAASVIFRKAYGVEWKVAGYDFMEVWGDYGRYDARGTFLEVMYPGERLFWGQGEDGMIRTISASSYEGRFLFVGDSYLEEDEDSPPLILSLLGTSLDYYSMDSPLPTVPNDSRIYMEELCRVCLKRQEPGERHPFKCQQCFAAHYCSVECLDYDLPTHELQRHPRPRWAPPSNFVEIFGADNPFDPTALLVDSYRMYLKSKDNITSVLRRRSSKYPNEDIFENDPVITGLKTWLMRAYFAYALPPSWDPKHSPQECIRYAMWNSDSEWSFAKVLPGSLECDVFVGRLIDNVYLEAQYGSKNVEVVKAKLKQLGDVIHIEIHRS